MRLRYDLANNECKQIQNRRSQIRERATGFVNTEDLSADADEDAAEIAQLEADIELTGVQYYEAWETRKTYEQVIKRLKYEASTYPKELEALDRTEHAKDHDYESMRLMLKDANHVKDMANKELAKVDEGLAQERRERERDLQARRRKMQLKQEAAAAHERRVAARRKALYKEKEDVMERMGMVGSNLTPLKSSSRSLKSSQSDLIQSERDMIAQYEAQFAQIKEVAGADGVEEVIEVFSAQEAMHKMLAELSSASQLRIDALQSQRAEAEVALEQARYGGEPLPEAGGAGAAAAAVNGVDERERQHEVAQLQGQRDRQRVQRLHRVSGLIVEARRPSLPAHPPARRRARPPPLPNTHTHTTPPPTAPPPRLQARVAIEHLSNIVTTTAQLPLLAGSPRRSPSSPAATVGQSAVSDAELAQQLRDATAQLDLLFGEVAQHNEGHSPLAMRRQLPRPATFSTLLHPSEAGPPQGPQDELAGEAEARVLDRDYSMLGLNLEVLQTRARASHPPPTPKPAACRLPPAARSPLPAAHYPPPVACRLPPAACGNERLWLISLGCAPVSPHSPAGSRHVCAARRRRAATRCPSSSCLGKTCASTHPPTRSTTRRRTTTRRTQPSQSWIARLSRRTRDCCSRRRPRRTGALCGAKAAAAAAAVTTMTRRLHLRAQAGQPRLEAADQPRVTDRGKPFACTTRAFSAWFSAPFMVTRPY